MTENSQAQPPQQPPQGYPPPPYYYPPPPYEEDEINLLDLWRVIWGSKWLIISITVLCTAIAVAAALLMTPIYRSEVLLAPVSDEQSSKLSNMAGQFGGLAALAGVNLGSGGGGKQEAIALLKSRVLAEKFIQDEKLLPVIFEDLWDVENKKWDVEDQKLAPTMWDAVKTFNENIRSVSEDSATGLVTLTIEWKDPKVAADWALKLVNRVNSNMRNRSISEAEKSMAFLNKELSKTSSVELQQAIYSLIESQIKTIMLANVREEYSFKIIDPPTVADPDDEVKPNKKLLVVVGCIFGFFMAISIVFLKDFVKSNAHPDTSI